GCPACRESAEQERRLHSVLSESRRQEVSPELLVRSRQALEEALDREQHGWRGLAEWFSLWPGAHPSRLAVALTLVVLGFGLGWALRPHAQKPPLTSGAEPQLSSFLGGDWGHISSISQVSPDPDSNKVRITVNAEHRVTLEGSLDNPRIRQILVDAVKSYDNPGIRLDTLDALKQHSNNPSVQDALLYALGHDPNTGVRLEALRCVRQMDWSPKVRQALITAVRQDSNPGVRVAAIDDLVRNARAQRDEALLPVLTSFAQRDSNAYVRMKALAAVHELRQDR
ncbi:MAG TPA: HEAT repeat domain-containing protein, partial [Terriglobia bacterium]|nr:HEAT repeat domain-containing protein [Terriglobia bacterium]